MSLRDEGSRSGNSEGNEGVLQHSFDRLLVSIQGINEP